MTGETLSRRATGVLLLLSLALLLPAPAEAQSDDGKSDDGKAQDPFVRCTRCKNLGMKECPEHRKLDLSHEGEVQYCSFIADCPVCGGVGWIDCDHCENPAVEARLAAKRAEVAKLRDEMQAIDETGGRPLQKIAVPHLVIVCEVDSWKVGKKRLGAHDLAHLYARRMDALFHDYQNVLGAKDEEFQKRIKVLLWGWLEDHLEGSRRFCELTGNSGVKLLGATPVYSVPVTKQLFQNDQELYRAVAHNVAHLILSHQDPAYWIGNVKGGWADAGLAHWFEDRIDGVVANYCYQEVDTTNHVLWNEGHWRPAIRQLLVKQDLPSIAELFEQNTDTLTLEQHALAFAVFDYLVTTDAAKTNQLLKRMRERASTRDALAETFGINPLQLEERVHAWIEETYPLR